ncbi:hypothetical protein BKA82DRAFT_293059 [Pisolithus tinctorius]|uniref:Uncharacterized protein n=1 Tax=Pisolithus tinctorius Marx 270 TaxID=870435 RepID=A0A0C3JE74_PISTI|nr:hypothetical protein BKA82DRAFT_293059 [Pisolithus tinctorius]KIN95926.1 hypothetical protein M404DRAFT_293059 [Pisolithus tinctorius Marx 270]
MCCSSAAFTRENLGVALLYVLADRCIGVIDAVASEGVLQKFTRLLLTIPLELPFGTTNELVGQLSSHYPVTSSFLGAAKYRECVSNLLTAPLSSSLFPGSTGTTHLTSLSFYVRVKFTPF